MKKWLGSILFCLGLLSMFVPASHAQAVYTATPKVYLQGGAGVFYENPDYNSSYGNNTVEGASGWVDANLINFLGIEAEGHISVVDTSDIRENSFLIGPRFAVRNGKSNLYAKAMIGRGDFIHDAHNHLAETSASYNLYAFGGGLDYRISPSINFRVVDAEFQTWSKFKPNGLTPYVISTGLMYIIH
jgi:hypothetical protein